LKFAADYLVRYWAARTQHVGTTQDPEDTIHLPCYECGSQSNLRMPSSLPPGHRQTFAAIRSYCPQLTARGSPPCYCCVDTETTSRLEATDMKT